MTDEIVVTVPADDFRLGREEGIAYDLAQLMVSQAISKLGLEMGVSLVISGVGRELRRHLPVDQIQTMLRQFADSMPEAALGDR